MISKIILDWYDQHQRQFPWRAKPGQIPNPYHVYLSEIMLQQTTTTTVVPYFVNFINRWPTIEDLAEASLDDVLHAWQGLGYYARARNMHKCAKMIAKNYQGQFPKEEQDLLKLPGIGPYTAAAIAAISYDAITSPVDGNIIRILSRLYCLKKPLPGVSVEVRERLRHLVPEKRNGDFVQALMDIGATICLPKEPRCEQCPLSQVCQAFMAGGCGDFPVKAKKKPRPVKYAVVFWIEDPKGRILIQRRPEKGLLGGMMEFPSTPWQEEEWELDQATAHQPFVFKGELLKEQVGHTFTHFHLNLTVLRGNLASEQRQGTWITQQRFKDYAFPTVMRKVVKAVEKSSPL